MRDGNSSSRRVRDGPMRLPCLPAQRRWWVLDRMDPGNPALNIAVRWRLEGHVSAAGLDLAIARILSRHPALRTSMDEEDGVLVQRVEPFVSLHVPQVDLTALAEEDALAEAARLAQVEARTAFDLSAAPLIRVTRLRVREDLSILLMTTHRLVSDIASVRTLAREIGASCAALRHGPMAQEPAAPPDIAPPPGETLQRDESYWNRALHGLKPFELHPDRPRPPAQTSNGARVSRALERSLVEALLELSVRRGCTLYMTALAAMFALLQRWSGETDIAVGSQLAGEEAPGARERFIDTIVLRGDLAGDPTFDELLTRVRHTVSEGFKHLSTGLDRLIEMLEPERDLSRHALFSVHFLFERRAPAEATQGGIRLVELPPCSTGALYDLNFSMVEAADGWQVACEYNTDLFEPSTAGRLLDHLVNVLGAAAADSSRKIATLPMLGDDERRALVVDCNRTQSSYPEHLTVPALLEAQARRTPDAIALSCGEQHLSYRELDAAANRLAHELRGGGVARGSRVAVCLERSPDLVVALLAVLKAGGAYVPLDPAYPAARLAQIVEDARPAMTLTTRAVRERVSAAVGEGTVVLLDAEAPAASRRRDRPPDAPPSPDDVAYVIYTSGTTGRPKGVQVRHQGLTNLLWHIRRQPGLAADDTLVSVTTVSFDIAALELFLPLIVGAKLVVAQAGDIADGSALLRLLRQQRATVLQATPVTWQLLLAAGWRGEPRLKMLCGGEALSRALADQLLPHGELWNLYGPTETTIWSSALRVEPGSGPVPIGAPVANTQFYVLDAQGQPVPAGVPGELFIGGDGVALGYLNLPALTRERFVPDTFRGLARAKLYRTGDRVRRRPDGELEFLGRNDHQVKVRGFRIELGEIEAAIRAHPQVADCVAVAGPDASGETAIRAYVEARWTGAGATGDPAALVGELQASLRAALPGYMCPASLVALPALPRTANGKIDRSALPAPVAAQVPAGETGRPASALEQRLARVWSAVLDVPDVGVDSNFFEVGGHSLLAVRLLARIESEFGRQLSLAALFGNPTIAGQARLLEHDDARAFDFRQVVKLQAHGSRPPLIALNNTGIYYALSKHLGREQPFTSLQLFDPDRPRALMPRTLPDIAAAYVQLIRRVQRNGPYVLLGWCVAGTLAFEVARQLSASGQRVSRLILFDTLAPGHLQRLHWFTAVLADYSYRWKLIAADWRRTRLGPRRLRTFLANRIIVRKLARWLAPSRRAAESGTLARAEEPPLTPEQYDQWLLRYLEDAAASYQPRPYSGALTLFRSSQEPAGRFLDPQMGWGAFAEGGIEVAVIDGNHFSIFQEPRVAQMAQRIEQALCAP